jgi:hypothetical protein
LGIVPFSSDALGFPADEPAQRRVAASQAVLRRLNESMRRTGGEPIAFRCECGRLGCNALIRLTSAEYRAVRADRRRFAVVPAHEVDGVEHVVERHDGYDVVEAYAPTAVEVVEGRTA